MVGEYQLKFEQKEFERIIQAEVEKHTQKIVSRVEKHFEERLKEADNSKKERQEYQKKMESFMQALLDKLNYKQEQQIVGLLKEIRDK